MNSATGHVVELERCESGNSSSLIAIPEHLLSFELRRIQIPVGASLWQKAAWLEAQTGLWDEMYGVLDEHRLDHAYDFAREQALCGMRVLRHLLPDGSAGAPFYDLVAVARQLMGTVHKCEIPAVG